MDNFEIIEKLGSGSFSKVYKVRRKIDNQIYALKKMQIYNLSEKQKLNSLNEIRVLASINSKYIVNYKEAFLDTKDSTLCLVMEYADRGDLSKRIQEQKKRGKYFNERDIWKVFIQLVKGLKSLHDLNILHRDIKSSNIFLFSDGTAKLGDLNVCKILSKNKLGTTQAGTPSFAAPEVWMEKPYGLKSDIWSLGCVLYEIVTLQCPFQGSNVVELNNKILIGAFKPIPKKYSNDLSYIIEHMIKYEPEKRISCEQILECDFVNEKDSTNNEDKESSIDNIINNENQKLLETIYLPNNLLYLNNQLPKANYSQEIKINHNKKNYSLKPIKIKQDLKSICLSQNFNKFNSDGKLIHLINNKRIIQNSKIANNLNLIFNNQEKNKKNELDINKSSKNIKGPIKLMRINTNINLKNNEYPSEKIIHNNINLDEILLQKKRQSQICLMKNKQKKEIKNHFFIDKEKIQEILCDKKRRKSQGPKKYFKYNLKYKNDNIINNRYNDIINSNNEFKPIPTEANISDNKNEYNKYKINFERKKNLSNKCLKIYDFQNDKNDFSNNSNKKDIINDNNILPVLIKPSYKKNFSE